MALVVQHRGAGLVDVLGEHLADEAEGVTGVGHVVDDQDLEPGDVDQLERRREHHRHVEALLDPGVELDVDGAAVLHAEGVGERTGDGQSASSHGDDDVGPPLVGGDGLDNLPVALAERTDDGWVEVVVDVVDGHLAEGRRPLDPQRAAWCTDRAPDAPVGARIPAQADAAAWLREALELAAGGRLVVIDYARTTAAMAAVRPDQWLRTYTAHGRGGSPYDRPGHGDIPCDVAIDQLALVEPPALVRTQAEFLRAHGIDALVEEGRAIWEAQGLAGGLPAIAGRSRITEAEALLDPTGLGAFTVLEWTP